MSWTTLTDKWVKTKKHHMCIGCCERLQPPARMRYVTGVYDGDLTSSYMCEICDAYMTPEMWKEYDYEMTEGGVKEAYDYADFKKEYLEKQSDADERSVATGAG